MPRQPAGGRYPARNDCAVGLLSVVFATACGPASDPPAVDAVQEAFREGDLTTQESHGQRVFLGRCATCHGPGGRGDGQNAYNLKPPPPDFKESLPELPSADRRRVIEGGTATLGRSVLCPPWGRSLDEVEIEALLAYLEVTERPSEDEEDPAPGRRRWRRSP